MWVPGHFEAGEPSWQVEVIDEHPFGVLVTTSEGAPVATHVPVVIEPTDRATASSDLCGVRILGHLARANEQWQVSPTGSRALLIVGGPHGYVSPTVYRDSPAAPTWNYIAVHLTGTLRWIHEREENMRIIDLTIDRTEHNAGTEWDREPSRSYFERILPGVVGFELSVTETQSTFKLSQDEAPHRRTAVVAEGENRGAIDLCKWARRANPDVFPQ